jgi:hypothetical protein
MKFDYKIHPEDHDLTVKIAVEMIKNGFTIQESAETEMSSEDREEFSDSIILAPDYQREYRSTSKDESSLIESVLLGIPIPPIYLASNRYKSVRVKNVVDGQHRLRAFYRFVTGQFSLKGLKFRTDIEGEKYSDLKIEDKEEILGGKIAAILFKEFPGKDFELEVFNRYNTGTKPLTPQDIRNAVYGSKCNDLVNGFVKAHLDDKNSILANIYNITKDRAQKKKVHESIFVILKIIEDGIDLSLSKSPMYAEKFMISKSELEKNDLAKSIENYDVVFKLFNDFNSFISKLSKFVSYPMSKEIYGLSNRNYKFQISIGMILAGVFKKISDDGKNIENINYEIFLNYMKEMLNGSFLEDPEYNASSTNPAEIKKLLDTLNFDHVFK